MAPRTIIVENITITHPDKVLWPADGASPAVTKQELAEYFARVADRMLPHVVGRPISILRAPDGIGGQTFFQRHATKGQSVRDQIRVRGEEKPFLTVRDAAGLVSLAQAGVLELHPWGAKKDDPETPAQIVFDLDPAPDLRFDTVVGAAKMLRTMLSALGLVPFVKTTGGKGLHVVVPIRTTTKDAVGWKEAKDFALAVSRMLERDHADRFTTNMRKNNRKGKIFIDYLRNDRMASAVAPWSPRARVHAPIAVPLVWSALKPTLDPHAFTVKSVSALLRRSDPWKDMGKKATSLKAAAAKLRKT